jgi:hypothetical protein
MLCISHAKHRDGHVYICRDGKTKFLHRVVYEEKNGKIPEGMIIRHKCDNPSCINPDHLEVGTHKDNVTDRVERNRSAKGSNNGRAKLNDEKVREIRLSDLSISELSRIFNVDRKVIRDVKNFITWKHVN